MTTYISPSAWAFENATQDNGTEWDGEFPTPLRYRPDSDAGDDGFIKIESRVGDGTGWVLAAFPDVEVNDDTVVTIGVVWAMGSVA